MILQITLFNTILLVLLIVISRGWGCLLQNFRLVFALGMILLSKEMGPFGEFHSFPTLFQSFEKIPAEQPSFGE